MKHKVKILMKEFVTHDVFRFIVEKPKRYVFTPGQATEISINKPGWEDKKRPFTFTSLKDDLVLEFIIKIYPEHKGVTEQIGRLKPNDELIIEEPWGNINYKEEGVFIAGGAGITPFIAILRNLKEKNMIENNALIFSNKTSKDVILEKEFREMFKDNPKNLILTLTREKKDGYLNQRVDKNFLRKIIKYCPKNFYICGPKKFVEDVKNAAVNLNCKMQSIIIE